MSIPKLEVPFFELTLPSSGKKLKYRPFLVKEHKALMMATSMSDDEVTAVIEEIVNICTFNKVNAKDLPSFDLEFIFTQLRSKSLGEDLDLIITCRNCSHKITNAFDLTTIEVERQANHTNKFLINDTIGVEMRYPRFHKAGNVIENYEKALNCIKAIWTTGGDYHEVTADDEDEIKVFVDSMTIEQFKKIETFFDTMPRLRKEYNVVCPACSATNAVKLEGLINFFV